MLEARCREGSRWPSGEMEAEGVGDCSSSGDDAREWNPGGGDRSVFRKHRACPGSGPEA